MPDLDKCTVLMVIPTSRFKDAEFKTPKEFLERKKAKIKIACAHTKDVYGMDGMRLKPDVTFDTLNLDDYAAVVFIGGMGTRDYWDNTDAQDLARKAVESGKVVGAISTAPVILARAGLLDGKDATVYFSESKQITDRGAKYTAGTVAVADKIITCKGPEAAEKFALALIKYLGG